ncbi:ABC transporter permease [Spirosoma jeollabukense]
MGRLTSRKKEGHTKPPGWATWLLSRFSPPGLEDELQGDLLEMYAYWVKTLGVPAARWRYGLTVLRLIHPITRLLKKPSHPYDQPSTWQPAMIHNYLKIAWRYLLSHKVVTAINVSGLGLGVAACLLITLYIVQETSYDQQVPNAENIYRVYRSITLDGQRKTDTDFSANFAATIQKNFPEIEKAGRLLDSPLFYGAGSNEIRMEGQPTQYHEEGFAYADQAILDILRLPLVRGEVSTALVEPHTVVISERKAAKYFKDKNPIGSAIYLNGNDSVPYRISGVMKNRPTISHLSYDFLLTLAGVEFGEGEQTRWLQSNYTNYVQIKPGTTIRALEEKMTRDIVTNYLLPALRQVDFANPEAFLKSAALHLQPLRDIHLYSGDIDDGHTHGDIRIIWLFGAAALFILLIGCVNFVNLSTAQSANRAKEVGLRKVVGSGRGWLIGQFLAESTLITMVAFGVGITLTTLLLPFFNTLSGKALAFPWQTTWFVPVLVGSTLLVGFLAGIYPAFYLSGFNPVAVLKGKLRQGTRSTGLRSSLVVFQFAVSMLLLVGTLVISRQMNYILTQKVGFDRSQVIQLYGTNLLHERVKPFKSELKRLPGVVDASISDYLPIEGTKRNGNTFFNQGKEKIDPGISGQAWAVDADYLATLGMRLVAGRNFSEKRPADSRTTIINQTMAQKLGLPNPVGKKLSRLGNDPYEIIGVVQDFHSQTLQNKIEPLALFFDTSPSMISVKVNTQDMPQLLTAMEAKWKEFVPHLAFRYTFMDQSYARMYDNIQRVSRIFTSFACLAIFIACLGLFGLAAFTTEQRTKEIGVRKVLGASVASIVALLSSDFLKLVVVAIVLASPLAWWIMSRWLQDFAYKIDLDWWLFALAGGLAVGIALVTVSYQSVKAALANPVKSLRSE